jgi:hypothetical protein
MLCCMLRTQPHDGTSGLCRLSMRHRIFNVRCSPVVTGRHRYPSKGIQALIRPCIRRHVLALLTLR